MATHSEERRAVVACEACGARASVRARGPLPEAVACPRCGESIETSARPGWRPLEREALFGAPAPIEALRPGESAQKGAPPRTDVGKRPRRVIPFRALETKEPAPQRPREVDARALDETLAAARPPAKTPPERKEPSAAPPNALEVDWGFDARSEKGDRERDEGADEEQAPSAAIEPSGELDEGGAGDEDPELDEGGLGDEESEPIELGEALFVAEPADLAEAGGAERAEASRSRGRIERAEASLPRDSSWSRAPGARRSGTRALVGGAAASALAAVAAVAWAIASSSAPAPDLPPAPTAEARGPLPAEARRSIERASSIVRLAAGQRPPSLSERKRAAARLEARGESSRAVGLYRQVWDGGAREIEVARALSRLALEQGAWALARRVAVEGLSGAEAGEGTAELASTFNEAARLDPALHPEVRALEPGSELDQIAALGGGKSISMKLRRAGQTVAAFKPSQLDWENGWRAEVAAYLFCEAMPCAFGVPHSEPVRIERADFEALWARRDTPKQRAYAERFGDLAWRRERDREGRPAAYLYGVKKEWVRGFVDWPIEYTEIWRGWLDASADPASMDEDLFGAMIPLLGRQGGRYLIPFMGARAGATTRQMARGIADLLTFDFVTSNWDRFARVEAYYGVNNHFHEGAFLSLDNGAAFHTQPMGRVAERAELSSRFSRPLIAALRAADPAVFSPIFFPDPDADERARLATFWAQRDRLLERVDRLRDAHGDEAVLYFP